jgi:uncharacterized protein with beta-barrel porin domain
MWWKSPVSGGARSGLRVLRTGLLAGTGIALLAWSSTYSQGACVPNPAATDGQTVVCSGPSAAFDGGGFINHRITVQPDGVVSDGAVVPAFDLNSGNIVINNGIVQATSVGGISFFDDNVVTNNGTITVNVGGGFGIRSSGTRNLITNNNSIMVLGTQDIGIVGASGDTIINAATASITVSADGAGISASGDSTTTNNGIITAAGLGSIGMAVTNSTNNGMVIASGDANGGGGGSSSAAMLVIGGTGTNASSGQIVASGLGAIGMGALNLFVGIPAQAINNGVIVASGIDSLGMTGGSTTGTNPVVINNGTVIASGPGSVALASNGAYSSLVPVTGLGFANVLYGNVDFTNNGLVRATGTGAFAIRSDNAAGIRVINNGTIDGRILIDFPGAPGSPPNSLTNNGLLTRSTGPFQESLINGDFTQSASGTYAPRVSPNTATTGYDRLRVEQDIFAGSLPATLGGTLRAVVQPGLYAQTQTYLNVFQYCTCSNDELTTRFAAVISSSPFFAASVVYSDNIGPGGIPVLDGLVDSVDLTLTRIGFGSVQGMTLNQRAVGTALEAAYSTTLTGNAATLFGNLLAATSIGVLDQLSGEGTAALQNASFQAGSMFNNASLNQLVFGGGAGATSVVVPPMQYAGTPKPRGHEAFAAFKAPAAPPAVQPGRWRVWTLGFGGYRSIDGEAFPTGSANQSMRTYGGALGADYQLSPDLLLGFAAGGSDSTVSVPARQTTGSVTAGHFGLYGLKTWGAYYAAASASYARLSNETSRSIAGIGPTETATGRFDSDQLSGRLELGWKRAFAGFNLTPFVAIEPAVLWAHGYAEASTIAGGGAGILGLTFASRTTTSLPTFVGLQADARTVLANGAIVMPYGRLSWVHEFEPARQINAGFISVPGAAFTVDGARAASDAARLDTGAKVALDSTRSVFANLSGEWSGTGSSYSAMAGFRLTP